MEATWLSKSVGMAMPLPLADNLNKLYFLFYKMDTEKNCKFNIKSNLNKLTYV